MSQKDMIFLGAFLLMVVLILVAFRKKSPLGYKRIDALCTPAEKRFFLLLRQILPKSCILFAKVRIADLLLPKNSKDRSRWQSAFNKVACKHFDFVVCDKELRILFAIELDDASHDREDRKQRDQFVEWACKSAGLPLLRVKLQKEFDTRALIKTIERFCKRD